MEKILILGGSGLIGNALINELNIFNDFEIYATYFQNPVSLNKDRCYLLNIDDPLCTSKILDLVKPKIIISCLRGDYEKQLNVHLKAAKYLRENGGRLYFFSTTNVFDNDIKRPHYEDDLPSSCTSYGKYKIECEKNLLEILEERASILRIPGVWGKTSPRMKLLKKSIQNNNKILVYPELFINTNTDVVIAKKTSYIIRNNLKGIFHLTSTDMINHKEFNVDLIKRLGFHNANIEESYEEKGCFALLSKRDNEFPKKLNIANKDVIEYL